MTALYTLSVAAPAVSWRELQLAGGSCHLCTVVLPAAVMLCQSVVAGESKQGQHCRLFKPAAVSLFTLLSHSQQQTLRRMLSAGMQCWEWTLEACC